MNFAAPLRMRLHRAAARITRHAISTTTRFRAVRAATDFATAYGRVRSLSTFARNRAPSLPNKLRATGTSRREYSSDGFFRRALNDMRNRTQDAPNSSPDPARILQRVKNIRETDPEAAAAELEKAIERGALSIDDPKVLKQYIKSLDALSASGTLSSTNTTMLQALKNQHQSMGSNALGAAVANGTPLKVNVVGGMPQPASLMSRVGFFALQAALFLGVIYYFVGDKSDKEGGGFSLFPHLGGKVGKEATGSNTTFDDVKGVPEAKEELVEIVEFLKDPSKFETLGGKLPKGVLLVGPPGTGKTLLAKAVAGEAGVPFLYASGAEFEEVFVGLGAKRVRDLFNRAKAATPCIVFIDEIDAVGGKRGPVSNTGRQTINQLLAELDGFEDADNIIVIAATNFVESLDSALIRPGRFDRHVYVNLPDVKSRTEILELYLDKCPVDETVNANVVARGIPGASGADLANLVNMAAIQASVEGKDMISHEHLEWAKDKILMGPERKSAVMRPQDLKCTAYHETGHALVALMTDGSHPVHKATIMPRGQALGMVSQLPEHDVVSMSKKEINAKLDVLMGGRVAEEVFFGEENVTTGASSDMQQATRLATRMVTQYGFTEAGGLMFTPDDNIKNLSPEHRAMVDREVNNILTAAYNRAKTLITRNKDKMHVVAQALLKHETLSGKQLQTLLANGQI